jgi:hypothetical protein
MIDARTINRLFRRNTGARLIAPGYNKPAVTVIQEAQTAALVTAISEPKTEKKTAHVRGL